MFERNDKKFKVMVQKLYPDSKLPTQATPESAGYDLYARIEDDSITITPNETNKISVGISTSFPKGYGAFMFARSGLATKSGLAPANKVGIVDSDYRGEWFVPLHNHSTLPQTIHNGDRIAQVVFMPVESATFLETTQLPASDRGDDGFGSTGQ